MTSSARESMSRDGVLIDEICADCHRLASVMMAMTPGKDGRAWSLCVRCWLGKGTQRPLSK